MLSVLCRLASSSQPPPPPLQRLAGKRTTLSNRKSLRSGMLLTLGAAHACRWQAMRCLRRGPVPVHLSSLRHTDMQPAVQQRWMLTTVHSISASLVERRH